MTLPDSPRTVVPAPRVSSQVRRGPTAAHSEQLQTAVRHLLQRSRDRCEQSRQLLDDSRATGNSYTSRPGTLR